MGNSTSQEQKLDNIHQAIKDIVPEYKTGDLGFDHVCISDYCYGIMGTDWKDKYTKANYHKTWYTAGWNK